MCLCCTIMNDIYQNIIDSSARTKKQLAVLIDPDKMKLDLVSSFISKVHQSIATHIFVGGSEVNEGITETLVLEIKKHTNLPVVLFPGDVIQITDKADGILFLSLVTQSVRLSLSLKTLPDSMIGLNFKQFT